MSHYGTTILRLWRHLLRLTKTSLHKETQRVVSQLFIICLTTGTEPNTILALHPHQIQAL
jgi:hypothetical protein